MPRTRHISKSVEEPLQPVALAASFDSAAPPPLPADSRLLRIGAPRTNPPPTYRAGAPWSAGEKIGCIAKALPEVNGMAPPTGAAHFTVARGKSVVSDRRERPLYFVSTSMMTLAGNRAGHCARWGCRARHILVRALVAAYLWH
jgi:hypothetical protein